MRRLLRTMVGRVALIDADARIRLGMQACRALTSALLPVVPYARLAGGGADEERIRAGAGVRGSLVLAWMVRCRRLTVVAIGSQPGRLTVTREMGCGEG
jgi:hypothetical protein